MTRSRMYALPIVLVCAPVLACTTTSDMPDVDGALIKAKVPADKKLKAPPTSVKAPRVSPTPNQGSIVPNELAGGDMEEDLTLNRHGTGGGGGNPPATPPSSKGPGSVPTQGGTRTTQKPKPKFGPTGINNSGTVKGPKLPQPGANPLGGGNKGPVVPTPGTPGAKPIGK
ncbi:MAG: hypothetical protein AAF721_08995 [Myxococcota bacterium]